MKNFLAILCNLWYTVKENQQDVGVYPLEDNYILFPMTKRSLAAELQRALDDYGMGRLSNSQLEKLVRSWRENCDFLLKDGLLDPGITKYIGKRRSQVVLKILFGTEQKSV